MNRLQHETSPYLLQHADNPVDWHPWDAEALALAKREDKPILLSIGYSANHLCHVMASESFENQKVATFMNEHFINIKVDREERPDLDRIYQGAQQLLNRQPGGWPLTMILEPQEQLPVFGGTYFPPQQTRNQPSFRDILSGISKTYDSKNEKMKEFKSKMRDALAAKEIEFSNETLDLTMSDRACGQIDSSFDPEHGGFSGAPKSPHPAGLELMLDVAASTDEKIKSDRLNQMLDTTLTAMSRGGLFDHLAGGFFGYSVDVEWTIPHFEKMSYDNGQLLSVYAKRARTADNDWYSLVANQSADWIMRDMQLDSGGLCANLDSDLEDVEGGFYTWNYDDVRSHLGDDYDDFAAHYGLEDKANFGTLWHLRLNGSAAPSDDAQHVRGARLAKARATLLNERSKRAEPARDDKVLTASNALCIRGLADVGRELDRPDCIDAATRAVDYLVQSHWQNGRLVTSTRGGNGSLVGYLDDYAFLIDALLTLLSARWRDSDLNFAIELADCMLENFEDRTNGGFFFTSNNHETLPQRQKPVADDSIPSGNGNAVRALVELGSLIGESRYLEAAERALRASMTQMDDWPSAHATLVRGLLDIASPPRRVIIRCADVATSQPWAAAIENELTSRDRCYVITNSAATLPGLLASRNADQGAEVTAYVYRGADCSAPITALDEVKTLLKS
ncbi:MAG: hypothetical protein ACI9BW_003025 [Gammaproteobacteria bacterium]|jgi:uncharacterized protein YyaL (SSP411 family)